jgi:hypothetical protein
VIALGVLPLIRKLDLQHAQHAAEEVIPESAQGIPTVLTER